MYTYWDIHNGRTTDFCYDHWLGREDRLASSCLLTQAPRPLMVMDMVTENGTWGWFRLRQVLSGESLEHIASIHPPCVSLGDDRPQWRWEPNCQFSSKSTHNFLGCDMNGRHGGIWKHVWKLRVPQRI
ncbi:hypothetical protein V6N12_069096 [Hibiscus sabdariffa]|uniref:Uncharacterized protein n=1 Tax=Hibiscus sabdariffa TaxID=183260 RepID=A0ABR2FD02_9ROSI